MRLLFSIGILVLLPLAARAADPPRNWEPVHLTGKISEPWFDRNWATYYWREDFTFLLTDKAGKTWRIISREPTPAYQWRMGPTYTGLKVDWAAKPRVQVSGVKAVDRIPASFYDFKLNEPNLATALVVWVEVQTEPSAWKEFYVNNWFHRWGDQADLVMHRLHAGKPAPYDIYGFVRGQWAPFDKRSQAIIDKHKENPSLMFHGRVRTVATDLGYELELIDLIGRDVKTGGAALLHGDAKTIPLLDNRKADK